MDVRDMYEAGPPCVSRAVDGFVRIGMAGVAWGMFMGSYDAVKDGHVGVSRALYVFKIEISKPLKALLTPFISLLVILVLYSCTLPWRQSRLRGMDWDGDVFAGAYLGLNCGVETVRGKKDWINASLSGAITGAMVSARTGSISKILGTSVLVSAIATAGDFLRPTQYPPTVYDPTPS